MQIVSSSVVVRLFCNEERIRGSYEKVAKDEIGPEEEHYGRLHFVVCLSAFATVQFSFGGLHLVDTARQLVCSLWRPTRRVVQLSVNADEAKMSLLGLCDNLINALKLLANQQKDGDRPIQSIVMVCTREAEEAWTC